jgi:transcriptional regulator with XRE-family HTH domain
MAPDRNGTASRTRARRSKLSEFGRNVSAALVLAGLRMEDVAPELNISVRTLNRTLHGLRQPRPWEMKRLAEVVGAPESFLRGGLGPDGVAAPAQSDIAQRLEQIRELRRGLDAEEQWLRQLLGDDREALSN